MSNPDNQPQQSGNITTDQALDLCREIYPNLSWEVAIAFHPRFTHGKLYGTMEHCNQYIDVTLLVGGSAAINLTLGKPKEFSTQTVIMRDTTQLGKVDPAFDLGYLLKAFQRKLTTQARLNLIFAAYQRIPHALNETLNAVMWQCEIDNEEGGMK